MISLSKLMGKGHSTDFTHESQVTIYITICITVSSSIMGMYDWTLTGTENQDICCFDLTTPF